MARPRGPDPSPSGAYADSDSGSQICDKNARLSSSEYEDVNPSAALQQKCSRYIIRFSFTFTNYLAIMIWVRAAANQLDAAFHDTFMALANITTINIFLSNVVI